MSLTRKRHFCPTRATNAMASINPTSRCEYHLYSFRPKQSESGILCQNASSTFVLPRTQRSCFLTCRYLHLKSCPICTCIHGVYHRLCTRVFIIIIIIIIICEGGGGVKTIPACFRILSLHSIIFLPWELSTGVKKIILLIIIVL